MVRTVQLCPHSHQLTECQIFMWSSCINYIAINSAIYLKLVCSDIWNWTKIIKKMIFPSVFMYSGWGCSLDIEKIIFPSVVMELAKKWRLKYCSLECLPKLLLMVRCLLLCCVWPCLANAGASLFAAGHVRAGSLLTPIICIGAYNYLMVYHNVSLVYLQNILAFAVYSRGYTCPCLYAVLF